MYNIAVCLFWCLWLSFEVKAQYSFSHHMFFEQSCKENYTHRYQLSGLAPYAIAMTDTNTIIMNVYDTVSKGYNLVKIDWKGNIREIKKDSYGFASRLYFNSKRSRLYAYYSHYLPKKDIYIVYDSMLNIKDSIVCNDRTPSNWVTVTGMLTKKEVTYLRKLLPNLAFPYFRHVPHSEKWDLVFYISFANEDYIFLQGNTLFPFDILDRKRLLSTTPTNINLNSKKVLELPSLYLKEPDKLEPPLKDCENKVSSSGKNILLNPYSHVAVYGNYLISTYIYFNYDSYRGRDYVSFYKIVR